MLNFVGNPPFTAVSAQPGARRPSCFFLCFGFGLGVVLLCSCSCCVSCVGVGFFSSCLCSFFLCLSFLFLVFFLFFFLFVVVFRLSGPVPVRAESAFALPCKRGWWPVVLSVRIRQGMAPHASASINAGTCSACGEKYQLVHYGTVDIPCGIRIDGRRIPCAS